MICSQCKRRIAAPGKRLCVMCAAVLKARVLEYRLAVAQADIEVLRKLKVSDLPTRPVTQAEIDDAAITRCRRCDARFLPRAGHRCARSRESAAA